MIFVGILGLFAFLLFGKIGLWCVVGYFTLLICMSGKAAS